jgi:hypothetical protein
MMAYLRHYLRLDIKKKHMIMIMGNLTRYISSCFSKLTFYFYRRVLKNRIKIEKIPPPPLNHPLKETNIVRKDRIEQAKLAIGK